MKGDKTARRKPNRLWQRGFYDRVIRNATEYEKVWEYTEYNGLKEY